MGSDPDPTEAGRKWMTGEMSSTDYFALVRKSASARPPVFRHRALHRWWVSLTDRYAQWRRVRSARRLPPPPWEEFKK